MYAAWRIWEIDRPWRHRFRRLEVGTDWGVQISIRLRRTSTPVTFTAQGLTAVSMHSSSAPHSVAFKSPSEIQAQAMLDVNISQSAGRGSKYQATWVRFQKMCTQFLRVRLFIEHSIDFSFALTINRQIFKSKIPDLQKKKFQNFFSLKKDHIWDNHQGRYHSENGSSCASPQNMLLVDWRTPIVGMDLFWSQVVLQFGQIESNLFCVWCDQREYPHALNEKSGGTSKILLREFQKMSRKAILMISSSQISA